MVRSWFILALVALLFMSKDVVADSPASGTPTSEAATDDSITLVPCSSEVEAGRSVYIEKSKCETPRDALVYLHPKFSYKQYVPHAVTLKRCSGVCHLGNVTACVAIEKKNIQIPIRVYNLKTDKEMCALYTVEEHAKCGCGDA